MSNEISGALHLNLLALALSLSACGSESPGQPAVSSPDAAAPHVSAAPSVMDPPLATPPSCESLPANCGPEQDQDCCETLVVPGGSFLQAYDGVTWLDKSHPATISAYRLDRYEVTAGRFQQFLDSYAGQGPAAGSGRNPNTAGDVGWDTAWSQYLPADAASWQALLDCDTFDLTGDDPNIPARCVSWYEAFAFCVWDGGRLPTWLEWYYAAAGGREQRAYPWSNPPTQYDIDATRAVYNSDVALPVGSKPAGEGRFGQSDLSGNALELVLDAPGVLLSTECNDCQYFSTDKGGLVGGAFDETRESALLSSPYAYAALREDRFEQVGFRCARPGPPSMPMDTPPEASASATSETPLGAPIAETDYAQAMADLVCENMGPCCELRRTPPLDVERCKGTEIQRYDYYLTAFPDTLEFDPQAAGDCYARTRTWIEQCITPTEEDLAACRSVFRGLIPTQVACDYDFECALGPDGVHSTCTYFNDSRICRPDVPLATAHAGDTCSGVSVQCDETAGLVCLVSSGLCDAPRGEGGACASGVDCVSDTWCDTEQGVCLVRPETGACPNSGSCALTSYCSEAFECIPKLEDGATCTRQEECLSDYCRQNVCGAAVYAPTTFCDSSQPLYTL